MSKELPISLRVNGQLQRFFAPAHWTLLEVLRYRLNLTGSKQGCDKGDCGACTVLVKGKPVLSCLALIGQIAQDDVLTIEGLAQPTKLHPVQDAFDECGALQCGFCQSGMMMSAVALLEENKEPTVQEINEALGGNLCRCTGYTKIIEAVQVAAKTLKEEDVSGETL